MIHSPFSLILLNFILRLEQASGKSGLFYISCSEFLPALSATRSENSAEKSPLLFLGLKQSFHYRLCYLHTLMVFFIPFCSSDVRNRREKGEEKYLFWVRTVSRISAMDSCPVYGSSKKNGFWFRSGCYYLWEQMDLSLSMQ